MGCAMGAASAPTYINIFMEQFEEKHIYPYIYGKSPVFLEHIDNIFKIWNRTTEKLILFLDQINKKAYNHKIGI